METSLATEFGEWLRKKRQRAGLSLESLALKAKVSKQYLSVLERAAPHALTGKPVTPKVALVERLAGALGQNIDEARIAAGYAPSSPTPDPGLWRGFDELSPERQAIARRQVRAIIDALSEQEHDTDYIDDEEEGK